MKQTANINVYLILCDNDKILLSKRQNTGYEDGKWSLVSGHGENNESAKHSMMREAQEETGIQISAENLTIAHVMHRKTDRNNIDLFMVCHQWDGTISNQEPEKCAELQFFAIDSLPDNVVGYINSALSHIRSKEFYSEYGWD